MIIKIAHLYPDMLNLYGDRGNIVALTERMNARGIEVLTDAITMGKSFNNKSAFYMDELKIWNKAKTEFDR